VVTGVAGGISERGRNALLLLGAIHNTFDGAPERRRVVRIQGRGEPIDDRSLELTAPEATLLAHADEPAQGVGRECAQVKLGVVVGDDIEDNSEDVILGPG
jgi:hypothetical protein